MVKCQVNGCQNDANWGFKYRYQKYWDDWSDDYDDYDYDQYDWDDYQSDDWKQFVYQACNECHDYMVNHNNGNWDRDFREKIEQQRRKGEERLRRERLRREKEERLRREKEERLRRERLRREEEERLRRERLRREEEQRLRREEERKEEEHLKSISELSGIDNNQMIILDKNSNNNITNNLFYKGKIPLGGINNLIWNDVFDKLISLPNIIINTNQRIQNEENILQNINHELEEIEKRKEILLQQVTQQENKIQLLKTSVNNWDRFKTDKLEAFIQVAENCKEIENTLSTRLHEQLEKDINGFTDMNDKSDKPKLSLVFNVVGLSPEIISSLSEYDGELFTGLWDESEAKSLQEAKDILYCKEMLKEGFIPYTDHEECQICNCDNPDDLYLLFKEYKIEISHDLLKKYQLNGRRLVGLSISDIKKYFELPKDQIMKFAKVIKNFQSLHQKTLEEQRLQKYNLK